jgi:putative nucleotidyltransferase with HDIG domain
MIGRILFVGDQQPLWEGFRARSGDGESLWRSEFAKSGAEALALLAQSEVVAVVADIKLPDMSGLELLDEIMRRHPKAVRIVLSDLADTAGTMRCVGTGHYHILKPCDDVVLLGALNRAFTLKTWLPGEAVRSLISQMRWVPSPPALYIQVVSEMQSPDASVETIGKLIAQDPAITAKVLQLANSAVFGLQLQVLEPIEAVSYLGFETTKALVLLAHTFASFERPELAGSSLKTLWDHAVLAGRSARRIAQAENCGTEETEQASAAGLLHDIGKLLLAANLPKKFGQVLKTARQEQRPSWEIENQVFGTSHAELGALLLGIWGLPQPIVEAVASHHQRPKAGADDFTPATAVYVANVLAHEALSEPGLSGKEAGELTQLPGQGIEAWRQLCLEPEAQTS